MKKIYTLVTILSLSIILNFSITGPVMAVGKVKVGGYVSKKGKYVKPYYRTKANSNKYDNWSTKGNTNPITSKKGTKKIK